MTNLVTYARCMRLLGSVLLLASLLMHSSETANAQISGRPVAQPFFDYDWHARFDTCRWRPVYWGFDPFAVWDDECDEETGECRTGFVAHRPNAWYVSADFLPMTYDPSQDLELARFAPAGPTALSTSDLDPEFDSGIRLVIGRTLWGCYQVEGAYQGTYAWRDDAAVADAGNTLSSVLTGFANDGNALAETSVLAGMETAEFNVRAWLDMPPGPFDVSLLLGARYMNINERLAFATSPAVTDEVFVQADNDLWGVQLGINMKWLVHPRAYIDFDAKGAICHNNASQATTFNAEDSGASGERTAFIGDFMVTANWQLSPAWSIRAGYQAIFVNGVALASENLRTNAPLLPEGGPGQLNDRGEVAFHGPVLGVMWAR